MNEEGAVKGQVEVKSSKTEESSAESAPEIELNPFLVEPVLVKLLKLMEEVSQLKELRLMCQTWDEFNLKEIEERAYNGKLKAIDFLWKDKLKTKSEAEAKLTQFMGDTQAIPLLFSSFKFNFPESWTILCNHMEFFSIYPMVIVDLAISRYLAQEEEIWVLFTKFLESEICANLKEIIINKNEISSWDEFKEFEFPSSSIFVPSSENKTHKLQKLNMNIRFPFPENFERFQSAFASGKFANLTSFGIAKLESGNLDFPGLDLTKLTRLEVLYMGDDYGNRGFRPALKFISGLTELARNGMKLKKLSMCLPLTLDPGMEFGEFYFDNLRRSCSNLTQFFSSQSSTLETLIVKIYCFNEDPVDVPEGADIWCKIHLPQFEVLHSLNLETHFQLIEYSGETHLKLFEMNHSLPLHFPKLVNLTLNFEKSLIALRVNPATDEVDQLQLERLQIIDYTSRVWTTSFEGVIGSVKELKCPPNLLYGEILPWTESLRSLSFDLLNFYRNEQMDFKLNHLKKLERLIIVHFSTKNKLTLPMEVEEYLNNFKWATELPLRSITFMGDISDMAEEIKQEFIKYFPFPVEFKNFIFFINFAS